MNRIRFYLSTAALALALSFAATPIVAPHAMEANAIDRFVGDDPTSFDTPTAATDAFKATLAANDFDGFAKLLGLNPEKLKGAEGIMDRFGEIRDSAQKLVAISEEDGQQVLNLGDKLWPFPFPLRKQEDGKWSFDTYAGLEEIVNRRVGENELQAIATMRAYVDAQKDYASTDHDDDGVLEYAQKLISTEGQEDGLYWPTAQGDGDSPAGASINEAALDKAKKGEGYFGYHFRILRAQGNQVAGGRYHYVINGNMIAGFGLIAWPVRYAETGVQTFVVNQAGIVYQKDLGSQTDKLADQIRRFNPDPSWTVVSD